MAGRKPTPTKYRELTGNPQKRPMNGDEPGYPAGPGEPPPELEGEGLAEWGRITRLMSAAGVITQADRAVLVLYCEAWGRWCNAREKVNEKGEVLKGRTGFYQNPHLAVMNKAGETVAKLAAALGLDPTSRTRIKVGGAGPKTARVTARPRSSNDAAPPPKEN